MAYKEAKKMTDSYSVATLLSKLKKGEHYYSSYNSQYKEGKRFPVRIKKIK